MLAERAQPRLKLRSLCRGLLDDAIARVDLQGLECHCGGDRMSGIGEAMSEGADLAAFRKQCFIHALGHQHRGDGRVSGGQCLGKRHAVRAEAERLRSEQGPQAAKPADHLVGNHVDVVFGADRRNICEIGLRRNDHAARAHDRLGNECRHGFRTLARDQIIELARQPCGEGLLGLAVGCEAIVMRAGRVKDAGDRQVEIGVVVRQAAQRRGRDRDAVIGFHPADDLLFPRPA